ncbi:MAG: Rpn family recombination-promoting nuclease/putative transposase [Lactimicrobium sp.]|jgi:predicted transposase/invertase (TIGR01784 family)|uniref:Rpn family recombination-promoting nuclease/putative transposase n=1 Tax=Lactimicrobium sp. TaxID=2563780 RepID=UPI002F35F9EE
MQPFTNDLVFCVCLAEHPEITQKFIEIMVGKPVEKLSIVNAQQIRNLDLFNKSVRFDVLAEDIYGNVYDLEMQTTLTRSLPKRIRYYQAVNTIDTKLKGRNYEALPDNYVIFICTFDPFQKGEAVYHFQMMEENYHHDVSYNDGVRTVVINTEADDSSLPFELRSTLNYIRTGIPDKEGFTNQLHNCVMEMNASKRWRDDMSTLAELRNDSKAEGRVEGKAEQAEKTALMMLHDGKDISEIQRYSGLTLAQITKLMKGSRQ